MKRLSSSLNFFLQVLFFITAYCSAEAQQTISGTPRYYPPGNGLPGGYYIEQRDSGGNLILIPASPPTSLPAGQTTVTPQYYSGRSGLPDGWYVKDSRGNLFPAPDPNSTTRSPNGMYAPTKPGASCPPTQTGTPAPSTSTTTTTLAQQGTSAILVFYTQSISCPPCKPTKLLVAGWRKKYPARVRPDIDLEGIQQWPSGVDRTPTIFIIRGGRIIYKVVGIPTNEQQQWIDEYLRGVR